MNKIETAQRCKDALLESDKVSRGLGIKIEVRDPGAAIAVMKVREDMMNGFGACHGGLIFTLADTAFAFACNGYNEQTVAAAGHIDFIRPAILGDELTASATEDYRGRKNGYYTIVVQNQEQELVALFRGRSSSSGKAIYDV
jgi:acyl-CoA thioesterase